MLSVHIHLNETLKESFTDLSFIKVGQTWKELSIFLKVFLNIKTIKKNFNL